MDNNVKFRKILGIQNEQRRLNRKIVVEGCPDGRNVWTYIIDLNKRKAIQLPSTEGVQEIDMDKGEIIAASYGYYPEGGRYTVNKAYSLEGKFLRQTSDPQPE